MTRVSQGAESISSQEADRKSEGRKLYRTTALTVPIARFLQNGLLNPANVV